MAVVSIEPGHNALCPFKIIGAAEGPVTTGERGAGHCRTAVEKGGGPPGTWIGNGAAELGFNDGDRVRWEDVEPLCGQFLSTRDPAGQIYLGRLPWVNAGLATTYQAKLAACPVAAAEEWMRLLARARTECHGPVRLPYFDATLSVDKAISRARASALAGAVEARRASGSRAGEDALVGMLLFAKRRTRRAKEPRVLRCQAGNRPGATQNSARCTTSRASSGTQPQAQAHAQKRCCDAHAELACMAAQLASRGELTHAQRRATVAAGLALDEASQVNHPGYDPEGRPWIPRERQALPAASLGDSQADPRLAGQQIATGNQTRDCRDEAKDYKPDRAAGE